MDLSSTQRDMIKMAAARQSAHLLSRLMERFIPRACRQEAYDELMNAFYREGVELTSVHQRLELEQMRQQMMPNLPPTG